MPRHPKPRWDARRCRWYANIGEPGKDGRAKAVFAPTDIPERDEARAWEWFRAERKAQAAAEVAPPTLTVGAIFQVYLKWAEGRRDEGKMAPEHYRNKQGHIGIILDELGAGRPAASLRPDDMTAALERLRTIYSPNYLANIAATVAAAFNWAARAGHLPRNPVAGHEAPTVPRAPERFAERALAAAFLRHWRARSDRRTKAARYDRLTLLLVRVLIRTGARPGELCDLWWSDIRWEAGRTAAGHAFAKATIPPERHKTGGKTGKPRTIYLTPTLTRAIRREMARPGRHPRHVFVHGRGRGGKGEGEPWESGSRLSKKILAVRREAIAVGRLPPEADAGPNRIVNYLWRHTAASTMLMLGLDVPTIAELLGTSPEMIHRTYGHLLDGHLADAAEKFHGDQGRRGKSA